MSTILMEGGRRNGRSLANERGFKTQLAAGNRVIVKRNGVYFDVLPDGDGVTYYPLVEKPEIDG